MVVLLVGLLHSANPSEVCPFGNTALLLQLNKVPLERLYPVSRSIKGKGQGVGYYIIVDELQFFILYILYIDCNLYGYGGA